MENQALIIEREYDAPIELVWQAITETSLMKKWYFDVIDFKAEVGCKFEFVGGKEDKLYTHLCEVLEVIPFKKLKYSWKYKGYVGLSVVTFELASVGDKTILKLIHEGLETFVNDDFSRDNFVGGWNHLIHIALKEFLDNNSNFK